MRHHSPILTFILAALVALAGCGGSGVDVDELAQKRLDAYVGFYKEIGNILENNTGEEALPKLQALKDEYEETFAAIGRKHAKLTRDERLEFLNAWNRIEEEDPRFEEARMLRHRGYRRMEGWTQETVNLIDEYSVIPGYADSTNLKATRPEVARRLGIE